MAIANLAKEAPKPPANACAVCRALAEIPTAEADGLRELLRNTKLRYSEISELIATDPDTPLSLHGDSLGKHARGDCAANEQLRGRVSKRR